MKLFLAFIIYLCTNSFLGANGLTFLYTTYGLQVYLNKSNFETEERYYIRSTPLFGFAEASRICEYFLNSTFLSYETIYLTGDAVNSSSIDLVCPDSRSMLSECVSNIRTSVDQVINITCRDAPADGKIVQLADGTVAIATRARDMLTWGHVCFADSKWDITTAELACASLGFGFVKSRKIKVYKKGVLGLYDFDCENASLFNQCTFKISSNANGQCNTSFVVAIECCRDLESDCISLNLSTNSPVVAATELTTSSVSRGGTLPTLSVSSSSTPVTITSKPSQATNSWVFVGAGVAAVWLFILASGFGLSVCIVCCCCTSTIREKTLPANLSQMLYANPNIPGTLRTREEQDPPLQSYYILP